MTGLSMKALFDKIYGLIKRDKSIIYLAGPMESLPDWGSSWREVAVDLIHKLDMYAINPCILEDALARTRSDGAGTIQEMRSRGDWGLIQQHMGLNIDIDLYAVSISDALLVQWHGEPMCGTVGEVTLAHHLRIPVHMATNVAVPAIPSWLLGCCAGRLYPTITDALAQIRLDMEQSIV